MFSKPGISEVLIYEGFFFEVSVYGKATYACLTVLDIQTDDFTEAFKAIS